LKHCLILYLPRNQSQEEAPSTTEEEKNDVTPTVESPVEVASPQEEAKPEEPASVEPDAAKEEPVAVEETAVESEAPAVEEVKGEEPSPAEPEATTIAEESPKNGPAAVEAEAPAAESEPPPTGPEAPVIEENGVESEASPAKPELENIPVSEEQKEDIQVSMDSTFVARFRRYAIAQMWGSISILMKHQFLTLFLISLFWIVLLNV
jgi:hypothetical protein